MTPAQHKTEAETILTAYEADDPGHQYLNDRAVLAQVHAQLAQAAGTGAHYATAEALLAKAATFDWLPHQEARCVHAALAHAVLADR